MFERIMGIITLKAPTYKAVAEDENATREAMMIVLIVALINGLVTGFFTPGVEGISIVSGLLRAVIAVVMGLVTWYVAGWLLATVAKAFGGKTDTNEMLRVTGYVYVFNIVGLLSLLALITPALICLAGIVGLFALVLSLIGYVIGVREAAEFSTGNAVITALIVTVASYIISFVGGLIAAMV